MFEIPVCLLGNITAGDILRVMEEASKTREMPASVGCKESQQQHYNMKSCALATLAPNGNLSRTDTASCLKLSLHTHHLHEVDRHTGQCQTKLSTVLLTHLQGTRCLHDAAHRQITEARIWQVANTPWHILGKALQIIWQFLAKSSINKLDSLPNNMTRYPVTLFCFPNLKNLKYIRSHYQIQKKINKMQQTSNWSSIISLGSVSSTGSSRTNLYMLKSILSWFNFKSTWSVMSWFSKIHSWFFIWICMISIKITWDTDVPYH